MNLSEFKNEIPIIFNKVKNDVREVLSRQRVGLTLGLVDMGMTQGGFIGGMYYHPGTDIIMNKNPLRVILQSQPYEITWAYTYHILLSLYLKSLGLIDEHKCREETLKVSKKIFKKADHPAIIMALNGIGYLIPNLKLTYILPNRRHGGLKIEYITGSDEESQSYFS